ncbi:hypothetical protein NIES4071_102270 (plasmid) [Calothrix sp. NIES-4071]|nr:hypothetical protein NIES4071_102270 [Calothrix sp. NIES-4071]BAZ64608.1 hypothetical protein NIES4105_103410 [Calothrix sp. NIES-4105]
MFDQKDNRIDQSYTETQEHAVKTAQAFATVLWELLKKLNEKWQEHQENKKVAVKVDEETYNLVEDPNTPGAYKWEKVDLNKESETSAKTQSIIADEFTEINSNPWNSEPIQYSAEIEQPFTEYQAQTIATRLISLLPEGNTEYHYNPSNEPPTIQITATTESGETKVLYAQLENGEVVKNAFTEELSQEEILDTAYEPLSRLLPPNSPLLLPPSKGNIENVVQSNDEESLITSVDNMLSQVVENNVKKLNDIKHTENDINNENLVESQPLQYDTDGLIIETDIKKSPEELNSEINTEIDEFTQIDEMPDINKQNEINQSPQYDADGLVLDENATVTVNPTPVLNNTETLNDEVSEFSNLEGYINEISDIELPPNGQLNIEEVYSQSELPTGVDNQLNNKSKLVDALGNTEEVYEISTDQGTNNLSTSGATFIAGTTANEVRINEENTEVPPTPSNQVETQKELPIIFNKKDPIEEQNEATTLVPKKQNAEVQEEVPPVAKKTKIEEKEEPSANYTYQTIASNPEVEPRAQQWARQSVIPIYEIKHKGEKTKVEYENNKNIALSATEMLKKYGTIETDGSRIYRSDAFAIRKQNGVVSIHRRGDEAKGFKEPLMEFKLNKDGTPDIKEGNIINNLRRQTTQHKLSPVEKQEFLIVAERINEGKGLPDLQQTDIREMGNELGSLALAGTLHTLQSFKETEVLGILNNALNQVKKDELTVGDFTIKRERDPENENRASLILTKDSNDGRGEQKLVQFDLEKTENGIESKVSTMNISDYDINQIKEISQNAYKRNQNLKMNFGVINEQISTKIEVNTDNRNLGQVTVDIHPWVQKEWVQMVDELQENPAHAAEIEEGLKEVKDRIDRTPGKATIPDQCVMYDKIITHKTAMAQESDDPNATVSFMNKNDIIQDLKELRLEQINQQFTPTQNLTQKQAQAKQETQTKQTPRPTPRTKKEEIEV